MRWWTIDGPIEPGPVVEAYKRDVDRTVLSQSLRRSVEERLEALMGLHRPYLRGAPPGLPFWWEVETLARGLNFTLTTDVGDVDLRRRLEGR